MLGWFAASPSLDLTSLDFTGAFRPSYCISAVRAQVLPLAGLPTFASYYRLKLTNPTTAELTDLEIALNLPDGVSKKGVEMSDDSTLDGSKITWKLAKLEAGKSVEYFFSTKVDTLSPGFVPATDLPLVILSTSDFRVSLAPVADL